MQHLAWKLALAMGAFGAAVAIAICALVVVPVNDDIDHAHAQATLTRATLGAEIVRLGGAPPAGATVEAAVPGLTAPRLDADAERATAIAPTGDGRQVVVADTRSDAIENRETIGVLLSMLLVVTAGTLLVIGGAWGHVRRLACVAAVAGRIAEGDFSARVRDPGKDEVAALGSHVDRMAARLEALETARREFVGKVSHDLRTPLTIVKGYAFTLERRASDPDDRRRLVAIGREADRLAVLVDDLLTLAQAGAGRLHVTCAPVAADELLDEIGERVRSLADGKGIDVEIERADGALVFDGDRRRLGQVLTNLAANALAHSPAGGSVRLAIREADDGVELRVEDRGAGVDPEAVPALLVPFAQRGPGAGSAGLGLAIAHELVVAHGGALALEPRDGGGTVARATIPRRQEPGGGEPR